MFAPCSSGREHTVRTILESSPKQHKATRTHPKSASTRPQDMHKLSARTRYQPRIGPVRPKPTQTNPNGIICVCIQAVCIRAVRGLINAQLDDNSSDEAARGSSQRPTQQRIQQPTQHGDPCSGSSGGPRGPYGTTFHAVFHAAVHTTPRPSGPHGTAAHSATHDGRSIRHGVSHGISCGDPSGPRWFTEVPWRPTR